MGTPGATVEFLRVDRPLWSLVGPAQGTWTPGGQVLRVSVASALQGDVLITSCTYNTEDRRLATVVSHPNVPPPATELRHQSQLCWSTGRGCPSLIHPVKQQLSRCGPWASISIPSSVQFSHFRLFATPWTAARQASLSITNSWSLLKLMSIEPVMPSNHLILCCPLLLLLPSNIPWVPDKHINSSVPPQAGW